MKTKAAAPVSTKKPIRTCKHCGCTFYTPCDMGNGEGCSWVGEDTCSACVSPYTGKKYKYAVGGRA